MCLICVIKTHLGSEDVRIYSLYHATGFYCKNRSNRKIFTVKTEQMNIHNIQR